MAKKTQLETEYAEPFAQWQTAQTPETTSALLKAVQPVLDKGIAQYVGAAASPVTASRARLIALQAIKTYDPAQARLSTHITNHLQGLKRYARQSQQIFTVPERMSLDAGFLAQRSDELTDKLGREPTMHELADATGLSPRRIKNIRSMRPPVAEGTVSAATETEESGGTGPAVTGLGRQKGLPPGIELLYHDLDPTSQKILEHSHPAVAEAFGFPLLNNQRLAAKLRLSPSAVSQRKLVLQKKLDEAQDMNLF